MQNMVGFISSELRFPHERAKKKKRYVTFTCPKCGEVSEKIYAKAKFIALCSHCAKGGFITKDFIARGKQHFGDKYSYIKTKYVNKRTSLIITCPVHGDFQQRAQDHLDGHGCRSCGDITRGEGLLLPVEVWLERITKYPLVQFKDTSQLNGWHNPVTLICKVHGEFTTYLGALTKGGHICKECSYQAHQSQSIRSEHTGKDAYLYYVYLPDIDMYKFGVTLNKEKRFRQLGNVQLIAEGVKEYTEACRLEHRVFVQLDEYRYKGTKKLLRQGGNTELFKQDVLDHIIRALQQ